MDMQSTMEIVKRLRSMQRRADTFGHSRDRLLLEIGLYIEDLEKSAERYEEEMYSEMHLRDSDGSACLGIQVAA